MFGITGGKDMKYMLLVYLDEQALSEDEREHCYVESAQLAQELNSSKQYLDASPLHPIATATSVRVRDGKRLVTDGPFAETREQLGGYYLIDAQNLDEAIRIAERVPPARFGTVEIRPVMEISGLPADYSRVMEKITNRTGAVCATRDLTSDVCNKSGVKWETTSVPRWETARFATSRFRLVTSRPRCPFTKRFLAGRPGNAAMAVSPLMTRWAK